MEYVKAEDRAAKDFKIVVSLANGEVIEYAAPTEATEYTVDFESGMLQIFISIDAPVEPGPRVQVTRRTIKQGVAVYAPGAWMAVEIEVVEAGE